MTDSRDLAVLIRALSNAGPARDAALLEIYRRGQALADPIVRAWATDTEFAALLGPEPHVTVGLAVPNETFLSIFAAWRPAGYAHVPPDQDAREFEIGVLGAYLDILTSRDPAGSGAIARYLARFGQGIQQVEYRVADVDRATQILREKFRQPSVYPETRPGADGTRINFFLASSPGASKVLIELYEAAPSGE
jgi:hypothetical protein